ncbi:hypothetical protein CEXT_676731 [Caerostris extrusa]|uniref:Uncharacterized protein n=1 Tax=Caerostris extrusa TaxID=172846 RepID=A0AAV4UYA6_CAEEX|nr:hypothetical protein CEXT_676731 [Caerostris extrusa]
MHGLKWDYFNLEPHRDKRRLRWKNEIDASLAKIITQQQHSQVFVFEPRGTGDPLCTLKRVGPKELPNIPGRRENEYERQPFGFGFLFTRVAVGPLGAAAICKRAGMCACMWSCEPDGTRCGETEDGCSSGACSLHFPDKPQEGVLYRYRTLANGKMKRQKINN